MNPYRRHWRSWHRLHRARERVARGHLPKVRPRAHENMGRASHFSNPFALVPIMRVGPQWGRRGLAQPSRRWRGTGRRDGTTGADAQAMARGAGERRRVRSPMSRAHKTAHPAKTTGGEGTALGGQAVGFLVPRSLALPRGRPGNRAVARHRAGEGSSRRSERLVQGLSAHPSMTTSHGQFGVSLGSRGDPLGAPSCRGGAKARACHSPCLR